MRFLWHRGHKCILKEKFKKLLQVHREKIWKKYLLYIETNAMYIFYRIIYDFSNLSVIKIFLTYKLITFLFVLSEIL